MRFIHVHVHVFVNSTREVCPTLYVNWLNQLLPVGRFHGNQYKTKHSIVYSCLVQRQTG